MSIITKGSKCVVYLATDNENLKKVSGTFDGIITLGEDAALTIRLDKSHKELEGKVRIIMLHAVLAIDILSLKQEQSKQTDENAVMYFN